MLSQELPFSGPGKDSAEATDLIVCLGSGDESLFCLVCLVCHEAIQSARRRHPSILGLDCWRSEARGHDVMVLFARRQVVRKYDSVSTVGGKMNDRECGTAGFHICI